jgi:hypothetical protein
MADGNPNRTTYWFNIERIEQLERAIVYSAFAQYRTSAYQLPDRVQLIDGDCVLESPIGDWRDGKFYATSYSLEQYRGKPYKVKA